MAEEFRCPRCGRVFKNRYGLGTHRNHKSDTGCQYTEDERREVVRLRSETKRRRAGMKKRLTFATAEERLARERYIDAKWIRRRRRRRAYARRWRALNPTYFVDHRTELRGAPPAPRPQPKPKIDRTPLAPLFGDIVRGGSLSFWDDELRMDLRQERELAVLEGRDPGEAERAYRAREHAWKSVTKPIPDEMVA